jgi:hypothetical protein
MVKHIIVLAQLHALWAASVYSGYSLCCGGEFTFQDVRSKAIEVLQRSEPFVQVVLRPTAAEPLAGVSDQSPEECTAWGRKLHRTEKYAFAIKTPVGSALYYWSPILGRPYTLVFSGIDPLSEQDGVELAGFDTRFHFPVDLLSKETMSNPPEIRLHLIVRDVELNPSRAFVALERTMVRLKLKKAYAFVRTDATSWPGDCRVLLRPSQWNNAFGETVPAPSATYYCVVAEGDRFCR